MAMNPIPYRLNNIAHFKDRILTKYRRIQAHLWIQSHLSPSPASPAQRVAAPQPLHESNLEDGVFNKRRRDAGQ